MEGVLVVNREPLLLETSTNHSSELPGSEMVNDELQGPPKNVPNVCGIRTPSHGQKKRQRQRSPPSSSPPPPPSPSILSPPISETSLPTKSPALPLHLTSAPVSANESSLLPAPTSSSSPHLTSPVPPPPPPPPPVVPVVSLPPASASLAEELRRVCSRRSDATKVNSDDEEEERTTSDLSPKSPGKLFEERGDDEAPSVSLKDYEEQSLREIARERQRIIQNQVVRRKTIHQWLFSDRQKDSKQQDGEINKKSDPHVKRKGKLHAIQKHWQSVTSKLTLKSGSSKSVQQGQRFCSQTSNDRIQFIGHYKMTSEQDLIVFDSELTNGNVKSSGDTNTHLVKEKNVIIENNIQNGSAEEKEVQLPNGRVTSESNILLVDFSGSESTKGKEVNGEHSVSDITNGTSDGNPEEQVPSENSLRTEPVDEATPHSESVSAAVHTLKETEILQTEAIREVVEIAITPNEADKPEPVAYTSEKKDSNIRETNNAEGKEKSELHLVVQEDSANVVESKTRVYRSTLTLSEKTLSNGIKESKTDKTFNSRSAETKIAMEIREMREREDELRRMRERLTSSSSCSEQNGHVQSDGSVKSDDVETPSGSESPQEMLSMGFRDHREIARAVSLDSLHLGQTYNIGYVFAHRRRENIKVRPLADDGNTEDKPMFSTLEESPIEREIRLAKEREEELKREKASICNGIKNNENTSKVKSTKAANGSIIDIKNDISKCNQDVVKMAERPKTIELNNKNKKEVNGKKEDNSPVEIKTLNINHKLEASKSNLTTQKLIATSRIQQEIEEQTKREMALRESGHIQTISQERTDSKVTRLAEVTSTCSPPAKEKTPVTKSPLVRDTSPTIEICEKSLSNGHTNGSTVQTSGNKKSPSSTTSSSSSSSKPLLPPARRLSNSSTTCRNVSMQRFIASRGKEIAFYNGISGDRGTGISDYYEIKPPQVRRGDGKPHRRSITAESRIQEELKEMRVREDELKRQRSRMLGQSQPNLSSLVDEDDAVTNGDCEGEVTLERCNSNPNLLENGEADEQESPSVGGPRRRSILIDQWEQRIQSTS